MVLFPSTCRWSQPEFSFKIQVSWKLNLELGIGTTKEWCHTHIYPRCFKNEKNKWTVLFVFTSVKCFFPVTIINQKIVVRNRASRAFKFYGSEIIITAILCFPDWFKCKLCSECNNPYTTCTPLSGTLAPTWTSNKQSPAKTTSEPMNILYVIHLPPPEPVFWVKLKQ
jgi:hypothetical protein